MYPHALFDAGSLLCQVLFSFQSEFGHSPRAAARQEDLARWSNLLYSMFYTATLYNYTGVSCVIIWCDLRYGGLLYRNWA